jgi:hypothetical protein
MNRIKNFLDTPATIATILSCLIALLNWLQVKWNPTWLAWLQNTIPCPIWGLLLYSLILFIVIRILTRLHTTHKERQDFAIYSATWGKGELTTDRTKQVRAKVRRRLKMTASNIDLGITPEKDPCRGTIKELTIVYYHSGQKRSKTYDENKGVKLPETQD